jgi:hypothetical protein
MKKKNKNIYFIGIWFHKKNEMYNLYSKQSNNNKNLLIEKINKIQTNLYLNNKYHSYGKYFDCKIGNHSNITKGYYELDKFIWDDSLLHYIKIHNIKPIDKFIKFINENVELVNFNNIYNIESKIYNIRNFKYIKIKRNQLMIFDALLYHGGYTKKYYDNKQHIYRFSEHAGLLDFDYDKLQSIMLSANISYTTKYDDDIFFPDDIPYIFDYEYVIHTHPPTPKPGGRADEGIMYEFPSIDDIIHFTQYTNDGKLQGSIVITCEGLYLIRRAILNKKIKITNINIFKHDYNKISQNIQDQAINKYNIIFNDNTFYYDIAQNYKYINILNDFLITFNLYIDYYSRIKDNKNNWILDDLYVPVQQINPKI